jgi:S1-C subfamily serine protease
VIRRSSRRLLAILATLSVLPPACAGLPGAAAPARAATPPALSLQRLFKQSAPAVVSITQLDAAGNVLLLASGFLVSSSGVLVTNHHVIAPQPGAVQLAVKLPRGDVYTDVRVVYAEARRDFAVLALKATGLPALKVGDSDAVQVGDQVVAIGNPKGLDLTLTQGIVEGIRLDPDNGYRFIQHQAPISPGSSGGPLLNMRGEVIGINTFEIKGAQNINGAVPINYVKPYVGDAATMTWRQYARGSAATPPGAATPPQTTSPGTVTPPPATASPSTPQVPPQPSRPGVYFESATHYRDSDTDFRAGYTAGLYSAVSLLATEARSTGTIEPHTLLGLFGCLNGHGETLGQFNDWVDSVVTPAPPDRAAIFPVLDACQFPASGTVDYFGSASTYTGSNDSFRLGLSAGLFDTVSFFTAAQGDTRLDPQKVTSVFQCLDGRGDTLGRLLAWVDVAMAGASPDNPATGAVLSACLR